MQHNKRGEEMMSWLPWYYGDSRIMNEIIGAQSNEIVSARESILYILNQFFVDTADAKGLELWEKELAITPQDESNLFLRRAHIKAKLRRPPIMTPQQIESIVNLFVENKSAKVIERPGTYHFDIDIDLDTTKIFLNELVQELEEAKPAHLGYGINIHWEIDISGTDSIRIGVATAEGGLVRIGIDVPKDELFRLYASVIPATTGIRTIRAGSTESREHFPLGAGFHMGTGGILKLQPDYDDIPKWYKDAWNGYAALRFGLSESLRGIHSIGVPIPDSDRNTIASAVALYGAGLRQYGLAPPDDSNLAVRVGIIQAQSGRLTIPIDPGDVPDWYKGITNEACIIPRFGIKELLEGRTRIGILTPDQERYALYHGIVHAMNGVVTIGADTGDLPGPDGAPTEARALVRIFQKLVEFAKRTFHLDLPEDSAAGFSTGFATDSTGAHVVPLEAPDDSKGQTHIGFAEASGGVKQFTADKDDMPKHYQNPLEGSTASIRTYATLYTKGTHKTQLSLPQDARTRPAFGTHSFRFGRSTIQSTKYGMSEGRYNILEPSIASPRLGIGESWKKKVYIHLSTPKESRTGYGLGALSYFCGTSTIEPETGDIPEWRRDILAPSRISYHIGISERWTGRRTTFLELPDDSEGQIAMGVSIIPRKQTILHLTPEFEDGTNPTLGIGTVFTGRTVIEADLDDLRPRPIGILPHAGLFQIGTLSVG